MCDDVNVEFLYDTAFFYCWVPKFIWADSFTAAVYIYSAASTEITVHSLEEKVQLNEQIERLSTQLEAALKNLEVQAADNGQLSR